MPIPHVKQVKVNAVNYFRSTLHGGGSLSDFYKILSLEVSFQVLAEG